MWAAVDGLAVTGTIETIWVTKVTTATWEEREGKKSDLLRGDAIERVESNRSLVVDPGVGR